MSLPKPLPVTDMQIGRRFLEITHDQPLDRVTDFFWFKGELRNGSLIAYHEEGLFEILIDGEQIDEP